jgi:FkbM family methyltransferase
MLTHHQKFKSMKRHLIHLVRKISSPFLFSKKLPFDFGRAKVIVTSRADIRLLAPGLEQAAGDLFVVVRKYVNPNGTVWDIGSNLGLLAFSAAVRVGTGGHVYSLEADPRYADIQTRTLRHFTPVAGKVMVLCAAVADQAGVLELVIPFNGHARNHLNVVEGNSALSCEMRKQVVTLTLDWLLAYWRAPDFVKIDVEGAEILAITGATRLFQEIRPIAYIECCETNADTLTAMFRQFEYDLFKIDSEGLETPVDRFVFNTLAKPRVR